MQKQVCELAQQIMVVIGDVDSNTALTTLEIAKNLLIHRDIAAANFSLARDPEELGQ